MWLAAVWVVCWGVKATTSHPANKVGTSLSPTLSDPFPKQHRVTAFTEQPPGSATPPRLLPFLTPLYHPAQEAPDAPHSSLWHRQITELQLNSSQLGEEGVRQHPRWDYLRLFPAPVQFDRCHHSSSIPTSRPLRCCTLVPLSGLGKNPSPWVVPSLLAVLSSSFPPLSLKREPPHLG